MHGVGGWVVQVESRWASSVIVGRLQPSGWGITHTHKKRNVGLGESAQVRSEKNLWSGKGQEEKLLASLLCQVGGGTTVPILPSQFLEEQEVGKLFEMGENQFRIVHLEKVLVLFGGGERFSDSRVQPPPNDSRRQMGIVEEGRDPSLEGMRQFSQHWIADFFHKLKYPILGTVTKVKLWSE